MNTYGDPFCTSPHVYILHFFIIQSSCIWGPQASPIFLLGLCRKKDGNPLRERCPNRSLWRKKLWTEFTRAVISGPWQKNRSAPQVITASADGSGKLFDLESGASLSRVKMDGLGRLGMEGMGGMTIEPSGNSHRYP